MKDNKIIRAEPVHHEDIEHPVKLSSRQITLCEKLDELHKSYGLDSIPSNMFRGASYVSQQILDNNLDWISQASNSLREILYPFWKGPKKCEALRRYGSVRVSTLTNNINRIYGKLQVLTHHGNGNKGDKNYLFRRVDFERILSDFEEVMFKVLARQTDIHLEVEEFLRQDTKVADVESAKELISINADAKNYFFTKADEKWLEWLWDNEFLDVFKKQSEDATQYRLATPEINYFREVANRKPEIAVKIILNDELAITEKKLRPELIDCILYICSEMKPEYLVRVIGKIRNEHWVKLLSRYSHWGFQYENMFEILYVAKEYNALLILANAVLTTHQEKEVQEKHIILSDGIKIPTRDDDKPFCLDDVHQTKVFEYLTRLLDTEYAEKVLELLLDTISNIASLGDSTSKNSFFDKEDTFYLFDTDLFTLETSGEMSRSYRYTVKELTATIKIAFDKLIGGNCADGNSISIHNIFNIYIGMFDDSKARLPNTRAMWQLRLYVLSLCPDVFKEELKKSFGLLFIVNNYYEVLSGAGYERTLQKAFGVFTDNEKREYIRNVIELFVRKNNERANDSENWHLKYGSRLLTVIKDDPITKEMSSKILDSGFKFIDEYEPRAIISDIKGEVRTVVSRAPITQEEFDQLSIEEIVENLKTIWTPKELVKKNTEPNDDYNPINADGISDLLKNSIATNFNKFIPQATSFFDSKSIHPHYVGAILKGTQDNIKDNLDADFTNLVELMMDLKKAGANGELSDKKEESGLYDTWLSDWKSIFYTMTDVLQELLSNRDGQIVLKNFQEKYRKDILSVIKYLLSYPDPENRSEESGATEDTGLYENEVSDPYFIAINSVRGRAFQALVFFVFIDGKEFKEKDEVKIKQKVKELYENTLERENTKALMFMYGYYLPTFYYRDKKWLRGLLPNIFSKKDKDLSLAATEGYLSQTLYKDMFEDSDFQKLYEKWIELKETDYTNGQKHWTDINEALATHLALAFIYFGLDIDKELGFKDGLLKKFWEIENPGNTIRYYEFISFIGRSVLTSDKTGNEWMKENNIDTEKFIRFWDWILKNDKITDPKVFSGFGFWINPDKEILNDEVVIDRMVETLEKSGGDIDWDYGLKKRLPIFAEKNGPKTLEIIRKYILSVNGELNQNHRLPVFLDDEIKNAISIIYKKGTEETKQEAVNLINELLEKGSAPFYGLKDILK